MSMRPTLLVQTTYFGEAPSVCVAEREEAVRLGKELYALLTRPVSDKGSDTRLEWGAGIPVRIGVQASAVDLEAAELTAVVVVLGSVAFGHESTRETALRQLHAWELSVTSGRRRGVVLPLLRSPNWRAVEAKLPVKPLLTSLYPDHPTATRREIVHAIARLLAGDDAFARELFISHAKSDLSTTGNATQEILTVAQTRGTTRAFFDATSLLNGEDLEEQIDRSAGRGIFIAVRGDQYSSRAWCQRELHRAKARRVPHLTVEVLTTGERRSSPYSGNARTRRRVERLVQDEAAPQRSPLAMGGDADLHRLGGGSVSERCSCPTTRRVSVSLEWRSRTPRRPAGRSSSASGHETLA